MRRHNRRRSLPALVIGLVLIGAAGCRGEAMAAPNIVFILADDLGWGDLGCYGQTRIRTPNIDRLAREGMLFTRHYSGSPVCAPSRCVLMTGLHSGHAFIRDNRQRAPREAGQYPVPDEAVFLTELLKQAGYATGAFGKWGLGGPETSGAPQRQGVDRFFGFNCQGVAHNYYPTHLWDNDCEVALENPEFSAHQPPLSADLDLADPALYTRFVGDRYAPDRILEEAITFVKRQRERPFFLFFPSTIPHLALQVPADALAEYQGKFPETPYRGDKGYLPQIAPRACYAAMVSRLDEQVGQLLQLLDELQLSDRTLVVFASDNGPAVSGTGGVDTDFFRSAGDLRGRKGSIYEGGLRVPLVARWPGKIAAGAVNDRVCGFEDWLPTLLELTGNAGLIPQEADGVSMAPTLLGRSQPERAFLYREYPREGRQQAVWSGRWKGVRQKLNRRQPPRMELYDLLADPNETKDVSGEHPDEVARLEAIAREQHAPSELFPLPALDAR